MLLKVKDVDFYYDSVKALDGVAFEVKDGGLFGIIGPNGSGKTTLLHCINRVLKPKVGAVLLDGNDIANIGRKEIAKMIGVIPQDSAISFPFTVSDIVLMGRNPHINRRSKESKRDFEIAGRAMELTGILHLANRRIDEISGGERQRVIIARALAQEPQILLLDEPTLHLDINHQLEILELVRKLSREQGLTVLWVSHDLNLAARFCQRLLLLNSGSIYAIGTTNEVLSRENLRQVYKVDVEVCYQPSTGCYNIIPLSPII
jgi:iron complex transport system ATP-binding protein